ncbi:MAG TPA: hypothetical protein VFR11_18730 [Micromonosporaceae bacterium]|jgi:F0F1-type ATP synthase assembly protein I|nr:hypothetical protein [Micromonosporaceae bacterium]
MTSPPDGPDRDASDRDGPDRDASDRDGPDRDGPDRDEPASESGQRLPRWLLIVAASALVGLAVAWFLISYFGTHDDFVDAVTEGIGAALGLLIVMSIAGAVASARTANRDRDKPGQPRQ